MYSYRFFTTGFLLFISSLVFSQSSIDGNVFDRNSHKPLQNVSISVSKKKIGSLSDRKGHFAIPTSSLKQSDTLVLSSVGYSTLKIPIADAMLIKDFFLSEESKDLENVTIKTYTNRSVEGSFSEVTGYFRSWTTNKGGGEIGRILELKSDDYKVERVRFKLNTQCDTCVIRLHIRSLTNGLPGEDLLKDSTTVEIHKSSFDDKSIEFDLTNQDLVLKNKRYLFIGLETISCRSANNQPCSMSYIGTEEGNYLYRTRDYREWEESSMHSLYLRIFYAY